MDYKKSMDEKEVRFPDVYERAIQIIQGAFCNKDLLEKLQAKRDFGLKKYGEHSFQSNFENCMKTPVLEHLLEELEDSINYTSHYIYMLKVKCEEDDSANFKMCYSWLRKLTNLYSEVEKVNNLDNITAEAKK